MAAVVITVESFPGRRRLFMTVEGDPADAAAAEPLRRVLARQRPWGSPGWLRLTVARPWAIADAWRKPGAVRTYHALSTTAGIRWERLPASHTNLRPRLEWSARVELQVTEELWRLAAGRGGPARGRASAPRSVAHSDGS